MNAPGGASSTWILRLLRGAAAMILYLYPKDFRARCGDDLLEVFTDVCRIRPGGGPVSTLSVGIGALVRLAWGGIAERLGLTPRADHHIPPGRGEVRRRPGAILVTGLLQDLRFAIRSLRERPGFSFLVVGMLALGVAANAAIFSAFNAMYLRPMPFAEPHRLVDLDERAPAWNLEYVSISYPDFHFWRERNRTFESMAVWDTDVFNLAADGRPDRVQGAVVHWELLRTLGLEPVLGRDFTAADYEEGARNVALVSKSFWEDRLQRDPDILGSSIRLDSREFTVIGVLPEAAVIPENARIWILLSSLSYCCEPTETSGAYWLNGVGRLAPGVSIEQARADLDRVQAGLVEMLGNARQEATPRLEPLIERYGGDSRPMMIVLLGAVGILLLVACGNIGGLMLARAATRGREMGVRVALGAGRVRIVRQLLTESLLVAAVGGGIGVGLGWLGIRELFRVMPEEARGWVRLTLDWRLAAFAVGVAAVTAVLFGLVPALRASRTSPQKALQEGAARGSAGSEQRRALNGLVVAEIALAVVLLVGAGLLLQSFRTMTAQDPGFSLDPLTFSATLPDVSYAEPAAQRAFFQAVKERLEGLGGVESAAVSTLRPLGGHSGWFFDVEGGLPRAEEEGNPVVLTRFATPDWLETLGIRLLHGRTYVTPVADSGPFEVVVNETFARTFWGELDVVGRRIRTGGNEAPWWTIVGVIHDTRHYGLDEEMRAGVFLPFAAPLDDRDQATVAVRSENLGGVLTAAREIVRELDPEIPLFAVGTMEEHLAESTWTWRTYSGLLGAFATAALLLALGGIYSTVSYAVNLRRREIGIRKALGAENARVSGSVVRQGMTLAGIGLAIGLTVAFIGAGLLSGVITGTRPRDPVIYAVVAAILLGAAALANLVPARRAASTDPVDALRAE